MLYTNNKNGCPVPADTDHKHGLRACSARIRSKVRLTELYIIYLNNVAASQQNTHIHAYIHSLYEQITG